MDYIDILFDGLGFFGFDETKLKRLKGITPKWSDRFYTKEWVITNFIMFAIVMLILV